jgi:hypothetical protein
MKAMIELTRMLKSSMQKSPSSSIGGRRIQRHKPEPKKARRAVKRPPEISRAAGIKIDLKISRRFVTVRFFTWRSPRALLRHRRAWRQIRRGAARPVRPQGSR